MNWIKQWWSKSPRKHKLLAGCLTFIWVGGIGASLDAPGGIVFSAFISAAILGIAAAIASDRTFG